MGSEMCIRDRRRLAQRRWRARRQRVHCATRLGAARDIHVGARRRGEAGAARIRPKRRTAAMAALRVSDQEMREERRCVNRRHKLAHGALGPTRDAPARARVSSHPGRAGQSSRAHARLPPPCARRPRARRRAPRPRRVVRSHDRALRSATARRSGSSSSSRRPPSALHRTARRARRPQPAPRALASRTTSPGRTVHTPHCHATTLPRTGRGHRRRSTTRSTRTSTRRRSALTRQPSTRAASLKASPHRRAPPSPRLARQASPSRSATARGRRARPPRPSARSRSSSTPSSLRGWRSSTRARIAGCPRVQCGPSLRRASAAGGWTICRASSAARRLLRGRGGGPRDCAPRMRLRCRTLSFWTPRADARAAAPAVARRSCTPQCRR